MDSNNWTEEKIISLIESETEESINLDFKSAEALIKSDPKKKEISKDVAAMANSDGGILIYGIDEENHIASRISFIDGNDFTKEWIEHVINSNIHQKIKDLKIIPIRFENDIKKTIYVVLVPRSDSAPHMSKDKRYYKRYNFESVPMEEYEIRQLYISDKRTVLEIGRHECGIGTLDENPDTIVSVSIGFEVRNVGSVYEDNFKLQVKIPTIPYLPMKSDKHLELVNNEDGAFIYATSKKLSLFQGESIMIGEIIYLLDEHSIEDLNKADVITATLFYSSGTYEEKILLKDLYKKAIENK